MRDDQSLRTAFEAEGPALKAWGQCVKQIVVGHFASEKSKAGSKFFVVEPDVRVKGVDSFIEKALYRNKGYADPLAEITDKVATRFVLLLQSDLKRVCDFVDSYDGWKASHDMDYMSQRELKPTEFLYESQHFVVSSLQGTCFEGVAIPEGTKCEIQIRTLLQHAYGELSHGTVYKGSLGSDPTVVRRVARSMALIETTDDIFENVVAAIGEVEAPMERLQNKMTEIFQNLLPGNESRQERIDAFLLDNLWPIVGSDPRIEVELSEYFADTARWQATFAKWSQRDLLFEQPTILLVMYLLECRPTELEEAWPLPAHRLDKIRTSVGIGN